MKKYYYLILLCLFMGMRAEAQNMDGKQRKYSMKHDIGFNATQLVSNLFGEPMENFDQFSFVYKYHVSPKGALRLGFGGRLFNNSQVINNAETRLNTVQAAKGRFGYEFRKAIGERWTTLLGLDALVSYQLNRTTFDSSFDVVTTQTEEFRYGGSPFFGLEFKINEHIRLSTELAFSFYQISSSSSDIFQNFPEFNETIRNTDFDSRAENPGFIYLTIRL